MQSPIKGTFRVVQGFGNDFTIKGKWVYKSMGYNGHMGVDFAGEKRGDKPTLYFPISGTIERKRDDGKVGYGKHIVLHCTINDAKYRFTFAHLDSFGNYEQGQKVKEGDIIGVMGTTGLSTGVHLHWDCMPLDSNNRPLYPNNGYNGFVDFLKLSVGTYTEKDVIVALRAFLGDEQPTYLEKVNNWLVENEIIKEPNFSEEQVRVIIAQYRINQKSTTPFPL